MHECVFVESDLLIYGLCLCVRVNICAPTVCARESEGVNRASSSSGTAGHI